MTGFQREAKICKLCFSPKDSQHSGGGSPVLPPNKGGWGCHRARGASPPIPPSASWASRALVRQELLQDAEETVAEHLTWERSTQKVPGEQAEESGECLPVSADAPPLCLWLPMLCLGHCPAPCLRTSPCACGHPLSVDTPPVAVGTPPTPAHVGNCPVPRPALLILILSRP